MVKGKIGYSFLLSTFIGAQLTDSSLETMAASLATRQQSRYHVPAISLFRFIIPRNQFNATRVKGRPYGNVGLREGFLSEA